jgi:ribose transport system permease protein
LSSEAQLDSENINSDGQGTPEGESLNPVPENPDRARFDRSLGLALWLLKAGPVLILAILVLAITIVSPVFMTTRNIGNVLAQTAVISVLALGQMLVIVTRGIDLSVGSTLALSTVIGALVFQSNGSGAVTLIAMVVAGVAVGLVNGFVFVKGRIPHPFIVTLATFTLVRGVALWLSDGRPIQGMPQIVQTIGGASLFGWVPVSTIVVVATAVLVWLLTTRMVWGRWIYAVGGNPEAARRTAIPTSSVLISVYVLSGLAAGVAGALTAGRTNAGAPTFGGLAELDAIAAVIIGGASFLGGRGTVANALVGALMIGVIRNAMNLANLASYFQLIVLGVVIIVAVESDVLRAWLEQRLRLKQAARS